QNTNPSGSSQSSSSPTQSPTSLNTANTGSSTSTGITILGENFSRDLTVWFGDMKATKTEFKCREALVCWPPEELLDLLAAKKENFQKKRKVPILLVRSDGVIYRTGKFYP